VNGLFLVACSVLSIVPLYFVLNSVYQDGVFGRASLLGISFCSFLFVLEALFGNPIQVHPLVVLLVSSFAVFACWHLGRFHFRVLKRKSQWTSPALKT
jgi:hypothetical protein